MTKATGKIPIAVFASGRGSNFEAIAKAVASGNLQAEIVAVVSDQSDAPVLGKAKAAGIQTVVVPWDRMPRELSGTEKRRRHESLICEQLRPLAPRFLVMAGYMRIVTEFLIGEFRSPRGYSRIVNVHPSLLPSFPGREAYRQAFLYGAKLVGVTVHLVGVEVDAGPICAQETFSIADCRSAEEVEARGLAVEHRLYPETLRWVLPEEFEMEKRSPFGDQQGRFFVRPH